MFENLNQYYPFNNNFKHNLRTIGFVCMGFMLIVLYFQPFGINFLASAHHGYFVLLMGLISASTFLVSTLIVPGLFPVLFESERWTVRKEIIWNAAMFVLLIAGFTLAAIVLKISGFQSLTLFRSGALALLPLVLFNLMNYNNSLKGRLTQVIATGRQWLSEDSKESLPAPQEEVVLKSDNGKESFTNLLQNVILIQSAGNYIEIFYRDGAKVHKQLIRQTLSAIEAVLSKFPNIRKCHRSNLVNIDQVTRLTGSSAAYTLEAEGLSFGIPVSRQHISFFRKLFPAKG
jgi:hypothetical protein